MIGNTSYRDAILAFAARRGEQGFTVGDALFVADHIPNKPIPKEHTVRAILVKLVHQGTLIRISRGRYAYAPLSWSF